MPNFYEYFIYPLLIAFIYLVVRYFLGNTKEYNTIADKFRSSFSNTLHSLKYENPGIETTCDILKQDVGEQKKAKAEFEQYLTEKERKKLENYWRIWLRPEQFRARTSNGKDIDDARKLGIKYVGFFQKIGKRRTNKVLMLIVGLVLIAVVVIGGYLDNDGWFYSGKPENSTISEIVKPQEEKPKEVTESKNTKIERTKITTKGASGKDNSGMKNVIDITNATIQLETSDLKKQYKDDLEILYEDMSRKGQLNGTLMLGRLSKFCLKEIDDYSLLIHNTILRVVKDSGVSCSNELAAELKNVVKSHLTGEIGNISGYIKQKNKLGPTLTNQLFIKETELNNKRSNELKKINSEIDLLAISLKNLEKEVVKTDRISNKFINLLQTHWVVSLITFISALLGIFSFFRRRQKISISSPTVIKGDVKGDVVERDKIQGDKVFGDKIVNQGQKPDAASSFQDRLSFIEAAKEGNVSVIESLLHKGVDVNTTDRDGHTALIWATRHDQRACVQKLIEKGCKVNVKTNDGNTAFTFASINSYDEIIDILKKSGADSVKCQDPKILDAAFSGDVDTLKALLEKGVSPNTITHTSGETTLMYAAGRNHFECAKLLLKSGADVNIKARDGHTVFNAIDFIKDKAKMLDIIESYKSIVSSPDATFIVFNPNASIPEILDSHNISGAITDGGYLAFTFTFDEPLENENYMIRTAGTANFEYELFDRTRNSFSIQFGEPCPDLVRLEFLL